ncbi:hypothetical protein Avbf_01703 [Armadillidium vulgare]|nr:hypothetical protein Avbf_01703 [Armadillidium vulgare]
MLYQIHDGSVEKDLRAHESELSSVLKLSSFSLDSSKAASDKRLFSYLCISKQTPRLSHIETPTVPPRPLSGSHPLLPIVAIRPTVLFPPETLPQEQEEEEILPPSKRQKRKKVQPLEKTSATEKRKEGITSQDRGSQTVTDDVHIPEESIKEKLLQIFSFHFDFNFTPSNRAVRGRVTGKEDDVPPYQIETGRPRSLKKGPSPEEGLKTLIVDAEVHAQEHERALLPGDATFEDLPPQSGTEIDFKKRIRPGEPHPPVGEIESLNLSPIGRSQILRTIQTPDENRQQFELSIFEALRTEKRLTFDNLLPENSTRKNVASTLAFLLAYK